MEAKLTANLDRAAQVTYALGSEKLHELVVEKNGTLDPSGVKEALKIVEGMMIEKEEIEIESFDVPWDLKRYIDWAEEELGMDEVAANIWLGEHLVPQRGIDFVTRKPTKHWTWRGDLILDNKQGLKHFPPPIALITGSLSMVKCPNVMLPKYLTINGNLNLRESRIDYLPTGLIVENDLDVSKISMLTIGNRVRIGQNGTSTVDFSFTPVVNISDDIELHVNQIFGVYGNSKLTIRINELVQSGNISFNSLS